MFFNDVYLRKEAEQHICLQKVLFPKKLIVDATLTERFQSASSFSERIFSKTSFVDYKSNVY